MGEIVVVNVEGVAEATRRISSLEAKIIRRCVTKGVRSGGSYLVKAARRLAPVRTGYLRRAISQAIKLDRGTGTVGSKITISRKKQYHHAKFGKIVPGNYRHLVVLGTQPHVVARETKKSMKIADGVMRRSVNHPGAKANDFMGQAMVQAWSEVLRRFSQIYGDAVEKETVENAG